MAKVKFLKRVKYNGEYYQAYETFEVLDKDLVDLQARGAVVVEERRKTAPPKITAPQVAAPKAPIPQVKEAPKEAPKVEPPEEEEKPKEEEPKKGRAKKADTSKKAK